MDDKSEWSPADSLSFEGVWNDAYPRQLAKDKRLSASEVRVWLILKTQTQQGQATTFPDYEEIMSMTNLGSRSTLSKCLKILQATRWIFVKTCRDSVTGQVRGNDYQLLDRPAPVSEACQANGEYMTLLERMLQDGHKHIRSVAEFELKQIQLAADAGIDPDDINPLNPMKDESSSTQADDNFIPVTEEEIAEDIGVSPLESLSPNNGLSPVQNMDSAQSKKWTQGLSTENGLGSVQKMDSYISSSSYINKTTTTNNGVTISTGDDLVFPESFSTSERKIALRYLAKVDPDEHQIILDELDAKIRTGPQSGNPIRNPLAYLNWLCNKALAGELPISSASLRAKANREREKALKHQQDEIAQQELARLGHGLPEGTLAKKSVSLRQLKEHRQDS